MTHKLNELMFDNIRNKCMANEIMVKKASGFSSLTIPKHCVSANYDIIGHKFGYSKRFSRRINPYRLGFSNPFVKTHFNLPFEAIGITEGQKYLNSRMSMYFPDWQSRWYEQHGHDDIDIFIDTQRPSLIDVNIRELSSFIEILKLTVHKDIYGKVDSLTWLVRKIDNSSLFDCYMSSGKRDKDCFQEDIIKADYNVFDCYDSQSCKPKFYQGHFYEDFDYKSAKPTEQTLEGYINYLEENDDELPKKFYCRRRSV